MNRPSQLLLALVCAACSFTPPPLQLPPQRPKITYRELTVRPRPPVEPSPSSDPAAPPTTPRPTPTVPPPAIAVYAEVLALRDAPAGPAADSVALTIRSDRGQPFRGASSLPIGTLWITGAPLQQWLQASGERKASDQQSLGAGTATVVEGVVTEIGFETPQQPLLLLRREGDGIGIRIVVPSPPAPARQELQVAAAIGDVDGAMLYVPPSEPRQPGMALLLRCGGDAAPEQAMAAWRAAAPPPVKIEPPAPWQAAQNAVGADQRRPALLALARAANRPRVIDVLLIADERALIDITKALATVPEDRREDAFEFEITVFRALLPRLERDDLSPALRAALHRQLGAAADDTSSLELMLSGQISAAAFDAALRDENLAALDDRHPGVRVRAHDWLLHVGAAVPDYQPLGSARERRQALRRHAEQQAQAAAEALDAANAADAAKAPNATNAPEAR